MRRLHRLAVLIGMAFVAACVPSPEMLFTQTAATATPAYPPSPRPTLAVEPTQAEPPTPGPTLTPSPTPEAVNIQSKMSPNEIWVARASFEQPGEQYHVQFKVSKVDGTQMWTVMDYWQSGFGYRYPHLQHWSRDSRYFYFSEVVVGDGGCDFFDLESTWQKISVTTGEITQFPVPLGRGHALSPDDMLLAYINADPPLYLVLRDLEDGREQKVLLPILARETEGIKAQAGNVVWSPNGGAVVLAIAKGDICSVSPPSPLNFSLVRVDIPSLDVIELVTDNRHLLRPLQWSQPNHIFVHNLQEGAQYWIDATTGQITSPPEPSSLTK